MIDAFYPATAIANEDTVIIKTAEGNFIYLLHEDNDILFAFTQLLAARLFRKAVMTREISEEKPLHRVQLY